MLIFFTKPFFLELQMCKTSKTLNFWERTSANVRKILVCFFGSSRCLRDALRSLERCGNISWSGLAAGWPILIKTCHYNNFYQRWFWNLFVFKTSFFCRCVIWVLCICRNTEKRRKWAKLYDFLWFWSQMVEVLSEFFLSQIKVKIRE